MLQGQKEESDQNSERQDQFQIQSPAINLPKGGGAIKGIGEKFAANPVTGTGSMTVSTAKWFKRSGSAPSLAFL